MNNTEFEELNVMKQIDYVNKLLEKGESLTKITHDLEVGRSTLGRNFKKADYSFDSTTKQYVKPNVPHSEKDGNTPNIDNEIRNIKGNVSDVGNKTKTITGNIGENVNESIVITKLVSIPKPKRTSYYLNTNTVKKIEKLAKESNMGISEFLQLFLDKTLDKVEIK